MVLLFNAKYKLVDHLVSVRLHPLPPWVFLLLLLSHHHHHRRLLTIVMVIAFFSIISYKHTHTIACTYICTHMYLCVNHGITGFLFCSDITLRWTWGCGSIHPEAAAAASRLLSFCGLSQYERLTTVKHYQKENFILLNTMPVQVFSTHRLFEIVLGDNTLNGGTIVWV